MTDPPPSTDWQGPRKYDAFVSYASEDGERAVRPLCESLSRAGVNTWYDESRLDAGMDIQDALLEGIRRSSLGVVVLSPGYVRPDRPWLALELEALLERGTVDSKGKQRIFPVLVDMTHTELERRIAEMGESRFERDLGRVASLKCVDLQERPSDTADQLVALWRHLLEPRWGLGTALALMLLGAAIPLCWSLFALIPQQLGPAGLAFSGTASFAISTWCWGLAHLALVPPAEPGNLDVARFNRRLALYFTSGIGMVVVYAELFRIPVTPELARPLTATTADVFALLVVFTTLLVSGLSYLEAHWYRVLPERKGMARAAAFRWLGLPTIYGTISFHWVYIAAMLALGVWSGLGT